MHSREFVTFCLHGYHLQVCHYCHLSKPSSCVLNSFYSRIIVLTFNRPRSLARLLRSLEAAHYDFPQNNPSWKIRLEIRIDGGGGGDGDLVRNVARNFRFSHGTKRIVISDTNKGIMAAWREAWSWRDRELFIVIEDDVEMSTLWYRALVNMWTAYGDR